MNQWGLTACPKDKLAVFSGNSFCSEIALAEMIDL